MKIFFDVKVGDKVLYMGQDNIINGIEVTKNDYYNEWSYIILKNGKEISSYWEDCRTSHTTSPCWNLVFTCPEAVNVYIERLQSDLNKIKEDISFKKQALENYYNSKEK